MACLTNGLFCVGYFKDNIFCHFCSSMISGLITTAASMPVDIAKTRIQNMKKINGVPEYKGTVDVLVKVVKNEGVLALWKGFTPYYARLVKFFSFFTVKRPRQFYENLLNFRVHILYSHSYSLSK